MAPILTERHMKIVCIGAGASGLCFAYKLQRSFSDFTLTLYEKNAGVGGTWFENRYPGCACDYDAHNYTYPWEPKADWPSVYASAADVRRYFQDFATKHNLGAFCKFGHAVEAARWDDEQGRWLLTIRDTNQKDVMVLQDECDILINATGLLNAPKWPAIEGLDTFAGVRVHSAEWPQAPGDADILACKRVGVIGNGSSGQQIVVALQPEVEQLHVFARQPSWVLGPFNGVQRAYSAAELQAWHREPGLLLAKRKLFESRINSYFGLCLRDNPAQARLRQALTTRVRETLSLHGHSEGDESKFIPDYAVGCRRPTPGGGYVEALCAPNVNFVVGNVQRIEPDGVIDYAGVKHQLDALICATGFDTSHRPRFVLVGRDGRDLRDVWTDPGTPPAAYLALAVPELPNYFVFYGPNNPFASGSFLATVEAQADYMLRWCDRWQTEHLHSFSPKVEAVADFQVHAAEVLKRTVWTDDKCHSWYKATNNTGSNSVSMPSLWPGSGLHYIEALGRARADDWDVRYKGSRWAWLGDGFSQIETDTECDLAYYVRESDAADEFLSTKKRRRVLARGVRHDPSVLHVIG